jgi:PKD repeat protein
MNKNYKTIADNFVNKMTTLLMLLCFTGIAQAQLSGNYTIDASKTTGGTNYASWSAFASAIGTSGVSGAVKVTVMNDETTSATVTFNAISGASSTNTISIDGNGKKLISSATYEGIAVNGADYLTMTNLTIQKTGTGTTQMGIRFYNNSDYNMLNGCTIEFTALSSASTSSGAYLAFASSQTSLTSTSTSNNGSYNTIKNCVMRTTNSNSPGPAYGIFDQQGTGSYYYAANNNTFEGNKIENFYFFGIYNRYTNGEHFINNDISRKNASSSSSTSTTMYGFYSYYTYGTSRSTSYKGNNIHDLPYNGASASSTSNYINTYYGFYGYYNYGTAALPFVYEKNTQRAIRVYSQFYHMYLYYAYVFDMTNNWVDNCESYAGSTNYMHYMYYCYDRNIVGNKFTNNKINSNGASGFHYLFYAWYNYNSYRAVNLFEDNVIDSNSSGGYWYTFYGYYNGNQRVSRNKITNTMTGSTYGLFYGFMFYYSYNLSIYSNLISNNYGYYGVYAFYSYNYSSGYKFEARHNTVHIRPSTYTYFYVYGYLFQEMYSEIRFTGNILDAELNYYGYPIWLNNTAATAANNMKEIESNSFLVKGSGTQIWGVGQTQYNSWNGFKGDKYVASTNNYTDPQWIDFAKGDMRSNSFETQNNVLPNLNVTNDITKASRNAVRADRGALENFMDVEAVKTDMTIASTVCAGHEVTPDITIYNKFADTIYNFYVAYSINGKATRELVTKRILPGDTLKYVFAAPMNLAIAGQTTVKLYLDIPDDNTKNDSFTFTTFVKPAPGGGYYEFSTKTTTPNTAIYQRGKANDITVIDQPVIYDVVAPRVYSNSSYGTASPNNWFATVQAYTASGKAITGATLTPPSGTTNLEVQFKTSDATLEDSLITVVLKVTDNNNGCDTFIKRKVLIYPSILPDFTFPAKICDGEAVLFTNTSNVNSGSMEFFWNFGTGSAADTSNAPEPVFQFPNSGKYKVLLTAKTVPYGFVFTKTYEVDVNAIPKVAFDKANACLGQDLVFTNKTNPLTAKMTWDFGNGATASTTDAKYKYTKAGTYNVTLSADLNGCVAKLTQKVYQFEKPTAKFTLVSGTCDNDEFVFSNQTTIGAGLVGSFWNFNDNGSVSTDESPKYTFSKPGDKNVKLIAMSEFGCKDSISKTIEVRESPKAGFTNTPACSLTPTEFTNTTADVAGSVANYNWSFGDGTTSKTKSPTKNWSNLGPKKVTLLVTLDNGCSDVVTKDLSVATQPKASFAASDVCAGDPVVFVNNTTWPQGDISYTWDFGDNTSSNNSDPSKLYNIVQTTSYNVTLYAYIAGGCADSITQRVTVNEAPRTCDFQATPDYDFSYYGIKAEPVNATGVAGGQNNVDYTWVFAGGGTMKSKDVNAAVNYDLQSDGEYTVTMKAVVRQTGCECSKTKKVVMNRAAVKDLQEVGVAVYPNPTAGDIKVATSETFGANITVNVMSIEGKMVSSRTVANEGVMSLNTDGLSNGVYLVQVTSGSKQVTKKITVQK